MQSNTYSYQASCSPHSTPPPRRETIDAHKFNFDGPISPVEDNSEFGSLFDDSSLLDADGVITDRPGDDEASIQADWMRFGDTMAMCTKDQLNRDSVASIPPRQSLPEVEEFDGIQFQAGESPLHCDDGFFTPDNSACDADDVFLDRHISVGLSDNYCVLESTLEIFQTVAGDSAPAGYQGAAIGGMTAASTNVANNSLQLSTNDSPGNCSAAYNNVQLPSATLTNVANNSMQPSTNESPSNYSAAYNHVHHLPDLISQLNKAQVVTKQMLAQV